MVLSHALLVIMWVIYCLLHSILASTRFKARASVWMKAQYRNYRIYYAIFAAITLIAIAWFQFAMDQIVLFDTAQFLTIIAAIIVGIGAITMFLYAIRYSKTFVGRSETTINTPEQLITTGPFKYVRHPLYIITFISIWAGFILLPHLSSLICNVIITGYTLFAIPFEEKKLEMEFGIAYTEYKKRTPMLIPRIWK